MDSRFLKFVGALAVAIFTVSYSYAANQGRIEGSVRDGKSRDPLPAANVFVQGTNYGSSTDLDGNFVIPGIPVGNYQLVVRYIGYQQKIIDVAVNVDETAKVDVVLDFQTVEGEVVEVTAQAEGQIAAINQQLSSNTITNVVSQARIRELPDVNAAESIGRLPGVSIQRSGGEANKISIRGLSPKYNTVTINGVRVPSSDSDDRSVDLSLISSNMLDGIEVKKAITPDMDADAIGGAVDLRLREAPDGRQISFIGQGGYNRIQEYYGNYNFSGTVSNRFLNGRLGIIANVNADHYDRSADKLSAGYGRREDENNVESAIITSLGLREENVLRKRLGGSLLFDYRLPKGKITLNGFRNELENDALYRVNNISATGSGRASWQLEARNSTTTIMTGALGIEQDFDWIKFDAGIARTKSEADSPEDLIWNFSQESLIFGDVFPTTSMHASELQSITNLVDSIAGLATISAQAINRTEEVLTTQFNVQMPFRFGGFLNGHLKGGAKFRNLDRTNNEELSGRDGLQYSLDTTNELSPIGQINAALPGWNIPDQMSTYGLPISSMMEASTRDAFLKGDYDFGFILDESRLTRLTRAFQSTVETYGEERAEYRRRSIGSLGSDYNGEEEYQGAYIMSEINLGQRLTFIPGVRWESDESTYTGQVFRAIAPAYRDEAPSGFQRLTVKRDNSFTLPMLHVQVKASDWMKVRLAYTETLIRPDYRQYAPITSIDQFSSSINAANALLEPAHSKNYDASISVFENKIGLFSVSAFHKTIDDLIISTSFPISQITDTTTVPPGLNIPTSWYESAVPTVNTNVNNPFQATYDGIEFDWQTNFWYLPSFLQGVILNVNYTYIESETEYPSFYPVTTIVQLRPRIVKTVLQDTSRVGRMPNQPKHIANVTLGYDYKGFSTRFSVLYQSDVSTSVDRTQPFLDRFSGDYLRLDLTVRQKLYSWLELFANFNNLNNRQDQNYLGYDSFRPTFVEDYGFTVDVGFRYRR
jgi:TonB-dependent receptor